ncbi:hypothetical protein ACFZB9_08410 [Kitasatospora sp. NPDC008050]|uniref:hypothetical protein n=1 Tax=Kitasatospora sp. NPDC008050 TaxID=3364021 RepID=UPI0036ECC93A
MRPVRRLFATALVASGTLLAGSTAAAAVPAHPVRHHPVATAAARTASPTVRPHGVSSSAGAGFQVAGAGTARQAHASWVQPWVDCSTNGSVAFWVGLDGMSSNDPNTVQIGTQVDCSNGNARYYGFYTLPGGTKVTFGSVIPEDNMEASIVPVANAAPGPVLMNYQLVLGDLTQSWRQQYVENISPAGQSAEAMVSAGTGAGTPLARFGYNAFTAVTLNNAPLSAGSPAGTAVTLNDPAGGTAQPTALSPNGNFGVSYGSTADVTGRVMTAVQGGIPRNQLVNNWTPGGSGYLGQTILRNTSPSLVILPDGGWEEAIMTAYKTLVIIGSDYTTNTGVPLAGGSSPSLAVAADGTLEVAFEGPNGHLMIYTPSSGGTTDLGLPMVGSSTPSIAALNSGGFEIAYVANTGQLAFTGAAGSYVSGNYVRGGTNPSLAPEVVSGYVYAFQGTDGYLYQGSSSLGALNQQIPLAGGTSPSIAWLSGGAETAFEQSNGQIGWSGIYSGSGPASVGSSSPSITADPDGFRIAYQSTGFQLAFYDRIYGTVGTSLGMAGTGTSASAAG